MPDLFKEILPSIMERKDVVIHNELDEKDYNPYMINKALSLQPDCLFYANEMNRLYQLPKSMQYQFYLAAIRKSRRRYVPWPKKQKDEDVKLVMKYFNYSQQKALEALRILNEEQIEKIRQIYEDIE